MENVQETKELRQNTNDGSTLLVSISTQEDYEPA